MIVYALYHPATGNYMPSIMFSHTTRGYSWWEPLGMHGLGGCSNIPRLFETKHAANMARHAWARGTHKNNRITESDGWEVPSYEVNAGSISTNEQLMPRAVADLKIVSLTLEESIK